MSLNLGISLPCLLQSGFDPSQDSQCGTLCLLVENVVGFEVRHHTLYSSPFRYARASADEPMLQKSSAKYVKPHMQTGL